MEKSIQNIKVAYFIGIGGIGMSAIARYFNFLGIQVSGYDRSMTKLTKQLEEEGIKLWYEIDTNHIPKEADIVIYTPAIPKDHAELQFVKDKKYWILKRSEVLGLITQNAYSVAVAGTHGKTTVSSLIAHILTHSNFGCSAFIGGIMNNYHSNFLHSHDKSVVVEADEFDRSFLRLSPNVAVITAVDADHLDIYKDKKDIENSFLTFCGQIDKEGILFIKKGLSIQGALDGLTFKTYALEDPKADRQVSELRVVDNRYIFDLVLGEKKIMDCQLKMNGRHNVENALVAASVADYLGVSTEAIKAALACFKGIRRRFDYLIDQENLVLIDDYAHHPEEIKALIGSVKELYKGKKITAIFQPHLYSRTQDFAEEFATSLSLADEVILLDIYPAREAPIAGVSSKLIFKGLDVKEAVLIKKDNLLNTLKNKSFEVLLIVGAGDIGAMREDIKTVLTNQ